MGALAVLCRDWRGTGRPCCLLAPTAGCARWLVGFLCVGALGTYKTAVLMPAFFPHFNGRGGGASGARQASQATGIAATVIGWNYVSDWQIAKRRDVQWTNKRPSTWCALAQQTSE